MKLDGLGKEAFFKTLRTKFKKCLDPTLSCTNPAIRAHTVQNSTALNLIADNNHVCQLKMSIDGDDPVCRFSRIGRNQASVFTGLCSEHDSEIFRTIDTKPISLSDPEQLFLLAYRSVTRELHASLEGAMRIQQSLEMQKAMGLGADRRQGVEATLAMLKAWGMWKYRYRFYDKALVEGQFGTVLHSHFVIENQPPLVAASAFFSVDNKPWGKPFSAVSLNVVPVSEARTLVIVSYPRDHSGKARRYVASVFTRKGERRLLALSHLMVNRAENFFVSPHHVSSWSDEKRAAIEGAFFSTIQTGENAKLTRTHMLF